MTSWNHGKNISSLLPSNHWHQRTKRSYTVIIRDKSGQMEEYFTLDFSERRWSPFQTATFFGVWSHQVAIIWPDKLLWILKAELSASWEGFRYNHHDWGEIPLTEGEKVAMKSCQKIWSSMVIHSQNLKIDNQKSGQIKIYHWPLPLCNHLGPVPNKRLLWAGWPNSNTPSIGDVFPSDHFPFHPKLSSVHFSGPALQ